MQDELLWCHDMIFNGLHCTCHVSLIDIRHNIWVLLVIFGLLLACKQTNYVFPHSSQSKVYLHLWWNRKSTSFCSPGVWLKLVALCQVFCQNSYCLGSLWHCRCHWHSCQWLSMASSLMITWAASRLNASCNYISWSKKATISGPCAACTHQIQSCNWHCVVHCLYAHSSIFAYSMSKSSFSFFMSNLLIIRVWPLWFIVYIWLVVY